jgi:hypothetical protein
MAVENGFDEVSAGKALGAGPSPELPESQAFA